jgi:N-acetyl-anhydromuramyl-L-alanine amidase AmpD
VRIPGIPYVQGRNSYVDRDGTKFAIAIHNTSNDASDEDEANYAKRRTDGVSSHLYCDRDSVTQSLSLLARAGHAGSNTGNENAIAVEITGANGWTSQQWIANVAWTKLGAALAFVCKQFNVAPRRASVAEMKANPKVRAFYSHDDMRRAWGGTTHTDPGPSFPWDVLFQAVNAALGGGTTPTPAGGDDVTPEQEYNIVTSIQEGIGLAGYQDQAAPGWARRAAQYSNRAVEARLTAQLSAMNTTIQALAGALNAGGGSVDSAAVIAEMRRLAAADEQRDTAYRTKIAELQKRLADALTGETG